MIPRGKIAELEGLRGWLAWWVVADHLLGAAGFAPASLRGSLEVLRNGALAVDVFIILSGFVVFLLLDSQRVTWPQFYLRRFFRLYPVYLPCLALGWLGMSLTARLAAGPAAEVVGPVFTERWAATQDHLAGHWAAHLTMLHGAIPNGILPYSSGALLDPAWSISLEWQFYLLAPVFVWLLRRTPWAFLALGLAAMVGEKVAREWGGFDFGSFLPVKLPVFWVGGVSYYILKHTPKLDPSVWRPDWVAAAGLLFPALLLRGASFYWQSQIWLPVMAVLLAPAGAGRGLSAALRGLLAAPWIQALGRWSYVTYLMHLPLIQAVRWGVLSYAPGLRGWALCGALAVVAVPLTLAASALVSRWLEQPGIEWGRRLSLRCGPPATAAAPARA